MMMLAWYVGKGGQRPQTHIMFCIQGHKHTHVVHCGNIEATRHAWHMRTTSRSCRCPASYGKQPRSRHAANAKTASHGKPPRPRHAVKAKAAPMGKQPKPRPRHQPRSRQLLIATNIGLLGEVFEPYQLNQYMLILWKMTLTY